jgi:hypothetical protein
VKKKERKVARKSWNARLGFQTTSNKTTIDQIAIRGQSSMSSKRNKPSMPKMPWDDEKSNNEKI